LARWRAISAPSQLLAPVTTTLSLIPSVMAFSRVNCLLPQHDRFGLHSGGIAIPLHLDVRQGSAATGGGSSGRRGGGTGGVSWASPFSSWSSAACPFAPCPLSRSARFSATALDRPKALASNIVAPSLAVRPRSFAHSAQAAAVSASTRKTFVLICLSYCVLLCPTASRYVQTSRANCTTCRLTAAVPAAVGFAPTFS
jgi:hypothetical protein